MNLTKVSLLALVLALGLTARSHADTLFTIDYSSSNNSDNEGLNVGDTFTVGSSNLLVSALGAYVDSNDEHVVGGIEETTTDITAVLYSFGTTPVEIGNVVIGAGTAVDANGFAYAPYAGTLTANDEYAVTEFAGIPNGSVGDTIFFVPGSSGDVTTDGATLGGTVLNHPSNDPSLIPSSYNTLLVGGNLQYEVVPEPSAAAFLMMGVAGLLSLAYFRRKTA